MEGRDRILAKKGEESAGLAKEEIEEKGKQAIGDMD